jgi:hypothetical protein
MSGSIEWFLPLFVVTWAFTCAMLSIVGGWHRLAVRFPASSAIDGEKYRFASMSLGSGFFPVSYRSSLFVTVGHSGLALSVLFLLRVMHPPLFIPWSAIETVRSERSWLLSGKAVYLRGFNKRLLFRGRAGKKILEAFNAQAVHGAPDLSQINENRGHGIS